MKKLLFTFLFLSPSLLAFSQSYDDLSDGDFTNNSSCNGESILFTESKVTQNAMWQVVVLQY